MTADEFRSLAFALPDVSEGSHMGLADFRANGRVFASLGAERGMVALPPEEQAMRVEAAPEMFSPCAGAWGRSGYTHIKLSAADVATARGALACAHAAIMAKPRGRSKS